MEDSMNRINKIISLLALALCLGATPQAQAMGYFKAVYNSALSYGKKAVNSAITAKNEALHRIAMIVGHITPKTEKVTSIPQDKKALARAQMIMKHLVQVNHEPEVSNTNCSGTHEHYLKDRFDGMYKWYYEINDLSKLAQFEISREEILDANDTVIATIKFYKKGTSDNDPLFAQLFDKNDELVGFCISCINSISNVGFIADLHVSQTERRNGYGKILLAYSTKKLYEFGCLDVNGRASSHDLKQDESQQTMQTKLERFYGQFGAESLDGSKSLLGLTL